MTTSHTDLLYTLGAIIGMISFTIHDILWLRCVYTVASIIYITSAFYFGIFSMFFWNSLTLCINIVQIIRLLLERRPIFLPDHLKLIYNLAFQSLTPKEFLQLHALGKTMQIRNQALFLQDTSLDNLYFLTSGDLKIVKNKREIAHLSPGAFVGEMNFLSKQATSASVFADDEASLLVWDKKDLLNLKAKQPQLYIKFASILGIDLVVKLMNAA